MYMHIVDADNHNVQLIHLDIIPRPSSKNVTMDRIPLILPFHLSIYQLRRIILKHYKTPMTDQNTKDMFKFLPIPSHKRELNLTNQLVCASHPQPAVSCDAGTY